MTDALLALLLMVGWLALSWQLTFRTPKLPTQIALLISAAVMVGVFSVLGLT